MASLGGRGNFQLAMDRESFDDPLRFATSEIIRLYLEIYGLRPDNNGQRSYLQAVTVRQAGEDAGKKQSLLSRLFSWGDEPSTSMTINFARQAPGEGPVSGNVDINASLLVPGGYRVLVTVRDRGSGQIRTVAREFELVQ